MLYISYRLSSCKSHCRHDTYIYWYSTVTYGDWGVVLFFIVLTNLFVFTNQLTFLFPPSVHTVFSYMCVCVCVCVCVCEQGRHCVCAERPVRGRSTVRLFLPNMVCDSGDIINMYLSSNFQSTSHKRHLFNVHFNIFLQLIYMSFSCSVCFQKQSWNILLLHSHYHNLYFQLTLITSNNLPDTAQVQFSALNSFP